MTPEQAVESTIKSTERIVAEVLVKFGPALDANPKGLNAVVLAAVLRATADVIEMRFDEGNAMGELKQLVDHVRQKVLIDWQRRPRG